MTSQLCEVPKCDKSATASIVCDGGALMRVCKEHGQAFKEWLAAATRGGKMPTHPAPDFGVAGPPVHGGPQPFTNRALNAQSKRKREAEAGA